VTISEAFPLIIAGFVALNSERTRPLTSPIPAATGSRTYALAALAARGMDSRWTFLSVPRLM